ncbi:MAG TPA: Grx4 family monothiol glutaredoxin [Polyangiaceae bacterium]|nr:Grx4 family monothiol glutaredoxin [Polyangiaceae bacterium]
MDQAVETSIRHAIAENPVVLYMKGSRAQPQCGFSATVVQILDGLLPDYVTVDVLADTSLREGIKEFSSWPTIPQLYVRGEFIGGSDIVAALHESGELGEKLGELARPPAPKLTVTAAALAELLAAVEGSDECIRLDVSPTFEHDLCVGVPDPRDLIVKVGDLRISMPPASARRAEGLVIDVVPTPEGTAFKLSNPNEPARVKRMSATELRARLNRGEDIFLVDVRTPSERAIASIEGSRLLDAALREELEELPRERSIVCQCHSGVRSRALAEGLVAMGFRDVYNLEGGIDAWSRDVDPDVPRY